MSVYKIGKKRNNGCILVYFTKPNLPLTESEHDRLLELSKVFDLFFVFSKNVLNSFYSKKIAYLYGATFYSQESLDNEVKNIWNNLEYLSELYGYLSISVIKLEDLDKIEKKELDNLENMIVRPLDRSSFKSRHLDSQECIRIYKKKENKFTSFLELLFKIDLDSSENLYSTHTTEDNILYLKKETITLIEDFLDVNKCPGYIESFRNSDIKTFLSSVIERVCPGSKLNLSIKNVEY